MVQPVVGKKFECNDGSVVDIVCEIPAWEAEGLPNVRIREAFPFVGYCSIKNEWIYYNDQGNPNSKLGVYNQVQWEGRILKREYIPAVQMKLSVYLLRDGTTAMLRGHVAPGKRVVGYKHLTVEVKPGDQG